MLKVIATFTSLTLFPLLLEFFLRKRETEISIANRDKHNYKCTFTSATNAQCRQHVYNNAPCAAHCSALVLKDIVNFISTATESVSICIFLLTSREICDALIEHHSQGKQVRAIVDQRMWGCSGSKGRILQSNGVPVRVQAKDGSMMHHKFCLIDEDTPSAKLFIGTVNLTLQGLCSNWDTIVYTNDKIVIARLKAEFDELWTAFDTYKRKSFAVSEVSKLLLRDTIFC